MSPAGTVSRAQTLAETAEKLPSEPARPSALREDDGVADAVADEPPTTILRSVEYDPYLVE
jgi:hypothetical protein